MFPDTMCVGIYLAANYRIAPPTLGQNHTVRFLGLANHTGVLDPTRRRRVLVELAGTLLAEFAKLLQLPHVTGRQARVLRDVQVLRRAFRLLPLLEKRNGRQERGAFKWAAQPRQREQLRL